MLIFGLKWNCRRYIEINHSDNRRLNGRKKGAKQLRSSEFSIFSLTLFCWDRPELTMTTLIYDSLFLHFLDSSSLPFNEIKVKFLSKCNFSSCNFHHLSMVICESCVNHFIENNNCSLVCDCGKFAVSSHVPCCWNEILNLLPLVSSPECLWQQKLAFNKMCAIFRICCEHKVYESSRAGNFILMISQFGWWHVWHPFHVESVHLSFQ